VQLMTISDKRNCDFVGLVRFRSRKGEMENFRVVNKTISDGGITVDFWIIKVHTSSNSLRSSNSWGSSNSWDHRIVGDH